MASDKAYLDFILDQLSSLGGITFRPMMGEYILYYQGKAVGGIYDDRFLLKPTKNVLRRAEESGMPPVMELPYEGAREMLAPDPDDRERLCELVRAAAEDLPMPKKKAARGSR
ncbi:MAG: TfoX/Sxy family protein [Clostridia bacterium]|nr:TfoX/Sxy family protein [Clostridia bacterium]MBQ4349876.1 TfoX/Sxy family protein [Clostridia bacterium]